MRLQRGGLPTEPSLKEYRLCPLSQSTAQYHFVASLNLNGERCGSRAAKAEQTALLALRRKIAAVVAAAAMGRPLLEGLYCACRVVDTEERATVLT